MFQEFCTHSNSITNGASMNHIQVTWIRYIDHHSFYPQFINQVEEREKERVSGGECTKKIEWIYTLLISNTLLRGNEWNFPFHPQEKLWYLIEWALIIFFTEGKISFTYYIERKECSFQRIEHLNHILVSELFVNFLLVCLSE